jgi:type IV secretion system protein VirB10
MTGSGGAKGLARKADPERLELRARPRAAVRFRKGLIVCLAAAFAGMVAAVSWVALGPPELTLPAGTAGPGIKRHSPEAIEGVPAGYDEVPILGPPLPGDLGRPILRHRTATVDLEDAPPRAGSLQSEPARREETRSSALLVRLTERTNSSAPAPTAPTTASQHLGEEPQQAALSAGTIIPASLITGINSDVPGIILAQVTEQVRDSATGKIVLIPQGSRLVGEYDSKIAYGQRRAMLVWNRLVLPDGRSLALDKLPAADRAGFSGLADEVDFHGWRLLKGVLLSTMLGVATELSLGGHDPVARALGNSGQEAASRAGGEITRRNLDVKPTISVRPGWPIRVILHHELVLAHWKG